MNSILSNIPNTLTSIQNVPSGTNPTTNVSITYSKSFIDTSPADTL